MSTGVTEAFDALYQAHLEAGNKDLIAYSGATETEIAQTEETMGFELTPELRELCSHVNGVSHSGFLPNVHGFPPLVSDKRPGLVEHRKKWLDGLWRWRAEAEYPDLQLESLPGAPSQPFLAFPGQLGIAVECGPIGTGAVMYHSKDNMLFYWVARSITDLFSELVEVHNRHQSEDFDRHTSFADTTYDYRNGQPDYGYWRWDT